MYRGNRLIGLGLFYYYGGSDLGKQLFFLGKSVSDYLDVLTAPDEEPGEIVQHMFDAVFHHAGTWRVADLDRLRGDSPVLQVDAPANVSVHATQEGACPQLVLTGSALSDFVKKSTRDAMRKHRNRAHSMGCVEFVTADRASLAQSLGHLQRLHCKRWSAAGSPGVFSDLKMVRFIAAAARGLLDTGMLRLNVMFLNDRAIAASLGMLHRQRMYFYLCDFDPEYSTISPGTLLTAYAMGQAAQEGARYFDFLQGEEEYKYKKWGAEPRLTYRIRFAEASREPRLAA